MSYLEKSSKNQGTDATVGDGYAPLGPPLLPWDMHIKRGQQQRTDIATTTEMSSDSRESLNHRDPPLFSESRYQSQYQDRDLKSLDSSLDIKTQDWKVSIPVSITRFKFQKSRFQSQYLDLTLEFPTFV